MIMDFAFDHVTTITLFQLIDEFSFAIIELTIQLFFNDVDDWSVIELVRAFR